MATKKQKRAEAMAKREAFMQEERERGLRAQQEDRRIEKEKIDRIDKKIQEFDSRFGEERIAMLMKFLPEY